MYRYGVARAQKEKHEVFELIKTVYQKQGYFLDAQNETAFAKFLQLSESKIFTAYVNDKLFGTLSVVLDSEIGLPMDSLYKVELQPMRTAGKKLAEASQYAVDREIIKQQDASFNPIQQQTASLPLLNLALHFAFYKSLDYLSIAINPKHSLFYKSLGFTQIGDLKYYPSVNNAPALAYILDVEKAKQHKTIVGMLTNLKIQQPDYSLFE